DALPISLWPVNANRPGEHGAMSFRVGVWRLSESGIRESNPSHSLGKAGHSRYTNPATPGILTPHPAQASPFRAGRRVPVRQECSHVPPPDAARRVSPRPLCRDIRTTLTRPLAGEDPAEGTETARRHRRVPRPALRRAQGA